MLNSLVGALLALFAADAALALESVDSFQLPNGLTVVVGVERRLPLVNVTCLYRVGSVNERPGITGVAHYVEHMAFRSTQNVSHADLTGTIERIGGRWNGYTWIDQTLYAATVPSWALESILRIEAERMARVRFDAEAFERERTSVVAELQGYENDPASILRDLAVATSFEIHPYRYNVIGWLTDVLTIDVEQAHDFYRDYYGPNHAYLSLVGDVDPEEVRALVERYFGALAPSRRSAEVRVVEPPQRGEKRVELRYPGSVANLLMVYRAPAASSPDFPAFLLMDAVLAGGRGLLFGGRAARPGTPLAEAVAAGAGFSASTSLMSSRAPFVYEVGAAAGSAAGLDRLEQALAGALDRMGVDGPSPAELERARRELRAEAAYESVTLADAGEKLSYFEALGSHELSEDILAALERVTASDVRRVARAHLTPEKRTLARHVPADAGSTDAMAIPSVSGAEAVSSEASPVPDEALRLPEMTPIARDRAGLSNGATIVAARRDGDVATLHLRLGFGSLLDPPGKEGLALLSARLLMGDPELASLLGAIGARWRSTAVDAPTTYSNRERFELEIRVLPEHQERTIEALGSALAKRAWTSSELERARQELLDEVAALETDADWVAERAALERTEGGYRTPFGSAASIASINEGEASAFLARARVGGALTVALVGPSAPADALSLLRRAFEGIPRGEPPALEAPSLAPRPGEVASSLPGKTQAEIVALLPGVAREHPDALALRLLSYVVGETGYAGRLGERLVDSGLTYSVYATPRFGEDGGLLAITTASATTNAQAVVSTVRAVLADLSTNGVTEAEWNEARAFRLGRLVVDLDSPSALARALADSAARGRDELDLEARAAEILAVPRDRLDEVARRYLDPDRLVVSLAGAVR